MSNQVKVEQPNLVSFVEKVAELAAQGYTIAKTNSGAPQSWGPGLYTCDMVLEGSEKPSEKVSEEPKQTPKEEEKVEQSGSQEVSEASSAESEETAEESKPKTRRGRRKSTSK